MLLDRTVLRFREELGWQLSFSHVIGMVTSQEAVCWGKWALGGFMGAGDEHIWNKIQLFTLACKALQELLSLFTSAIGLLVQAILLCSG